MFVAVGVALGEDVEVGVKAGPVDEGVGVLVETAVAVGVEEAAGVAVGVGGASKYQGIDHDCVEKYSCHNSPVSALPASDKCRPSSIKWLCGQMVPLGMPVDGAQKFHW